MKELDIVKRATQLLMELGAKAEEDSLYITVAFRYQGEEYGLQFTKRLFSVGLAADGQGRLYYGVRYGGPVRYVRVLPYWAEADVEKGSYPVSFWNGLYRMARALRKVIFDPGLADLSLAWRLRREAWEEHYRRPCRESLLLLRHLTGFVEREAARARAKARAANAALRQAYDELLRLASGAPHALNVLREKYPGATVERLAPLYWRAEVEIAGEAVAEWGGDPLSAAARLLRRAEEELAGPCGA